MNVAELRQERCLIEEFSLARRRIKDEISKCQLTWCHVLSRLHAKIQDLWMAAVHL
jgi:hypothetical protein